MNEIQRLAGAALVASLAGRNLNQVLLETWRTHPKLPPASRAAIQDLSFGALRSYGLLDSVLTRLLDKPVNDKQLRALLVVALYQLHYTRAKPFAVVDHAVVTAAMIGQPAAKGLVNAVLRNFLRRRKELTTVASDDLVATYNHPRWWIEKCQSQFPTEWQSVLQAANQPPPMTLRVNERRGNVDDCLRRLGEAGMEGRPLGGAAVVLNRPRPVSVVPGFSEGLLSVQDLSAQYAAELLHLDDGQRVLDACSAPGGKAGHVLEKACVDLLALDSSDERLRRVADNLARLQLAAASTRLADAALVDTWWDGRPFDRILIDAPCTGSGVVRRHPDIKWARRVSDIGQFVDQQARLLDALWPTLVRGGKLLYATCSVFREENQQQTAAFLARHGDASPLPLVVPHTPLVALDIRDGQIIPNDFHDGFFYALLAKR